MDGHFSHGCNNFRSNATCPRRLNPNRPRPRVIIIGAGLAGIMAAQRLAKLPIDVTVIDRTNHHTFQPLLYQVALAACRRET